MIVPTKIQPKRRLHGPVFCLGAASSGSVDIPYCADDARDSRSKGSPSTDYSFRATSLTRQSPGILKLIGLRATGRPIFLLFLNRMRRGIHMAIALLAIILLAKPFDCFA